MTHPLHWDKLDVIRLIYDRAHFNELKCKRIVLKIILDFFLNFNYNIYRKREKEKT